MACNSDFVQYIIDQCSGAGEIAVKKMRQQLLCKGDGARARPLEGSHPSSSV
jgi:hypothetical protein